MPFQTNTSEFDADVTKIFHRIGSLFQLIGPDRRIFSIGEGPHERRVLIQPWAEKQFGFSAQIQCPFSLRVELSEKSYNSYNHAGAGSPVSFLPELIKHHPEEQEYWLLPTDVDLQHAGTPAVKNVRVYDFNKISVEAIQLTEQYCDAKERPITVLAIKKSSYKIPVFNFLPVGSGIKRTDPVNGTHRPILRPEYDDRPPVRAWWPDEE